MDRREDVKGYYPDACGKDKREDSGNYYPGGTVVPQGKVPTHQLDSYIKKQEGLEVKTNTITDLREAVKDLAKAMGATVVSVFAAMAAFSAEVQTAKLEKIDLDTGIVVTNVVLDGVATTADLDGKRDKTDLAVYSSELVEPYEMDSACFPITVDDGGKSFEVPLSDCFWFDVDGKIGVNYPWQNHQRFIALNFDTKTGAAVYLGGSEEDSLTARFGGKPYEVGVWPRLKTTVAPTADALATTSTVAQVARQVVNTVWDEKLGVAWEARMHDGCLYYVAVTNEPPEVVR